MHLGTCVCFSSAHPADSLEDIESHMQQYFLIPVNRLDAQHQRLSEVSCILNAAQYPKNKQGSFYYWEGKKGDISQSVGPIALDKVLHSYW